MRKKECKHGHPNPQRNKNGACVPCVKVQGRRRYRENKQAIIASSIKRAKFKPNDRRDQQRAYRLGLPVAEVRKAIARADGMCESCGKQITNQTLCVDHDHETGRIRGVLCRFCNALEGMLNKQAGRVGMLRSYLRRATRRMETK